MGTQKQVIQIDAQINTHLGNLNDTVTKLKKGISDGVTKMDLSKGAGKAFSEYIRNFQNSYTELQKYIKKDAGGNSFIQLDDSGKAISAGKNLLKVFGDIQQVMQGINSKDAAGLAKLFPQGSTGDVDKLLKSLEGLSPKLKELQDKEALRITVTSDIKTLETEIQRIKTELKDENILQINVDNAKTKLDEVEAEIKQIQDKAKESVSVQIKTLTDNKTSDVTQRDKMVAEKNEATARMEQSGVTRTKKGALQFQGMTEGQWQINSSRGADAKKIAAEAFAAYKQAQSQASGLEKQITSLDARIESSKKKLEELAQVSQKLETPEGTATLTKEEMQTAGFSAQEIEAATAATQKRTQAQQELNEAVAQQSTQAQQKEELGGMEATLEKKKKQVEQLGNELAKLAEKANLSEMAKKLQELGFENVTEDSLKTKESIENLKTSLTTMKGDRVQEIVNKLKEMGIISEDTAGDIKLVQGALEKTEESAESMTRAERDMENLKNRMLDFFSISNSIRLFKRTLQQAFNTVKELDAVMTQTAVVTDFSVGDMWDKLPEYSARATELGASISSLYEATTLYYQQGLETEAAMGVGVETMKMARIAGLEAGDATQYMTAALRGFNMEVNELNATRVNDVYSDLAAITAADTAQIATAMGKTASIAASANMEFETTAALLAQIIETTQEAPETAGTAMKTIIARFTEVKSLFSEGQLKGEDEEGEAIDINKIDAALKSVGISLKDFLNGQKGIDDIFLELASKWDTLDLATQRYIATTAAGSRQQSRFIAMMSDYGRTMELVSAANNSAGASQRQFDKTQESLEVKLQKLKNAWQQFTMGIMNSDVIKFGVDILTKFLNIVNTLIDKLSGGSGLMKGFLGLGALGGGLWAGSKGLNFGLKALANHTIFGAIVPNLKKSLNEVPKIAEKPAEKTSGVFKRALGGVGRMLSSPTFWGVTVAVGAIAIIAKTVDYFTETEKEKRERLENQVSVSKDAEKKARSTRDSLKADVSTLRDLEKGFESLVYGTSEWKEQLVQANQQAIELLEKYEGLQLETGGYGQLTVSDESYQKVQDQLLERAYKAQSQQASASLELALLDYKDEWIAAIKNFSKYQASQSYAEWTSTGAPPSTSQGATLSGNGELVQNGSVENKTEAIFSLSDKQARTYLTALAEAGINSTNLANREGEIRAIIAGQGYAGDIDSLINSMVTLGADFDKLSASALSASTKIEGLEYSFFLGAAQNRQNFDLSDAAAANYLDFYYSSQGGLSKAKASIEATYGDMSKWDLLKTYAEEMGYYYSGDQVYYSKNEMDSPIQFGEDNEQIVRTLRSTLAVLELAERATDRLDKLSLTSDQLKSYEAIFGSETPSLDKWMGLNSVEEAYQALGLKWEDVFVDDKTLTALGGELQNILNKKNAEVQKQAADFLKYNSKVFNLSHDNVYLDEHINALTKQYGDDYVAKVSDAISNLSSLDSQISDAIIKELMTIEIDGIDDKQAFQAASDLISNISWTNPIKAAEQIKQAMESGDKATASFATSLNEMARSFLGAGSQVRYFIQSTDYSAVYEEIQKIVDKNGEFTATDVLELADDYESLDNILENTNISATGLAKTLELIGDGSLQFYELTDAVLAAMSSFDSLNGIVAETLKAIEDFDPGINETDVVDFLEKNFKTLSENIEEGYFGNSQNFKILDFILGPEWKEGKTSEQLKQIMIQYADLFKGEDAGLQNMLQNMISGKKYTGEAYGEDETPFDLSAMLQMSSEEAKQYMAETQGISEDFAGIFLTYLANLDPGIRQAMEKNNRNTAADKFWEEQQAQAGGEGKRVTVDQSEIDAFAEIQKLTEEEKKFFTEALKGQGARITQYRENGKLRETGEIIGELNRAYSYDWGIKRGAYHPQTGYEADTYNEQQIKQTLARENFSQEEQEQLFKDMIANATENGKKINIETTLSNGELKTIEVSSLEDYESQIRELEQALETELMSSAISAGIVEAYSQLATETLTINIQVGDETFTITADPTQAEQIIEDFYYKQNGKTITMNISGSISKSKLEFLEKIMPGITGEAQAAGIDIVNYADGIVDSPTTHDALVSEEGPELIYRADGTAYLSGLNGPEITKIHRGDTVYTAEETRQIFKNRGKAMPNFMAGQEGETSSTSPASGSRTNWFGDDSSSDSPSGSSTGSSGVDWSALILAIQNALGIINDNNNNVIQEQVNELKTSLDKLYNLLAQIEETTRQRERLERRYGALIKDTNSSIKEVVDNSKAQLAVLEAEKELQEGLIKGRQAQIEAYAAQNAGYAQYAGIETNAYGDQVMRIDWDAINAISNDDERKKVEEYVSKLEGWLDELADAENALWDIEDAVEEINERGKEEYLDLEEQIKEALISERQEEIDKLSAIDESINNANSSMMQAIQDTLSQQRQGRDNAKTEKELAEKERRLQYLKQDTSGANALEILELEKELAEGREDYTDTLIDQKIEELQKQNDQAAEQRQKQIEVLTKQKEIYERSEQLWKNVYDLISSGIDNNGIIIPGSNLETLLQNVVSKEGLSMIGTEDWWRKTTESIKAGMAWLQMGQQLENLGVTSGSIDFINGDGKTLTGTVQGNGDVKVGKQIYKDVYRDATGNYRTLEKEQTETQDKNEKPEVEAPTFPYGKFSEVYSRELAKSHSGDDVKALQWALQQLNYLASDYKIEGKFDDITDQAVRAFQAAAGLNADGIVGKNTREAFRLKKFKTGGVADFTGPAWLDGTKSRPEIILNQQDSRNFIQLKDILGSILKGNHYSSSSTENNGDTVYDIDINVEKLEREVDLDTISNYVERKITETARYRNNNTVKISR